MKQDIKKQKNVHYINVLVVKNGYLKRSLVMILVIYMVIVVVDVRNVKIVSVKNIMQNVSDY